VRKCNPFIELNEAAMMPIRVLARLSVIVCALVLSSCHYTEEEKRAVCCVLNIHAYEAAPLGTQIVINWYRSSDFDGDGGGRQGPYGDGEVRFLDKDDKIRLEVKSFLAENPKGEAADFFVALGMTCGPPSVISMLGATRARCEIELPVWVVCRPSYIARPLSSAPIPAPFQKPLAAVLHVSVDVSAKGVRGTSSRVYPVPGGHLCLRLP
jgi:hypothetical protein